MMEELLKEQRKTNALLEKFISQRKDPYELLTAEQIHQEFNIGLCMVKKMFCDKELPVQRYTRPFKVTRKAIQEYMTTNHDYLRA